MNSIVKHTLETIDDMYKKGRKITKKSVAEEAGVSKGFLYYHPEIVEKFNYYRILKHPAFDKKLDAILEENQELRQKAAAYEEALLSKLEDHTASAKQGGSAAL